MFKTIWLKIRLKSAIKAKIREVKNSDFEKAAMFHDQEKILLGKLERLTSKRYKPKFIHHRIKLTYKNQ